VREHLAPPPVAPASDDDDTAGEAIAGLVQGSLAGLVAPSGPDSDVEIGAVVLRADRLMSTADDLYEARGHVRLQYADTTVEAATITFDQSTGDVWAPGPVTITRNGAVMHTRDAHLGVHTGRGTLGRTALYMEAQNYYVGAAALEKTGPSTYEVEGGSFSACRPPNPTWEFRSHKMSVDLEGKVKARHVLFYWQGVPVLYLPYLEQNIADRRATGLLLSKPETSSRYGLTLDNSYYWVIDDSQDATLYFDLKGLEGFGVGGEYRYAVGPQSDGKLKLYRLQDDSGISYEVRADVQHHISDRTRARLNFHYLDETDDENIRGFSSTDTSRVTRNLVSDAFVSQRYADVVGTVNLRLFQDLVDRQDDQFQRLPELRVELPTTAIWGERLHLQSELNTTNFWRDHGSHGWRIAMRGELRKDMRPAPGIDLFARTGVEEAIYTFNEVEESRDNSNRILVDARLGSSVQLHRRYASLDHIIEPEVVYFARLGESDKEVPQIDRLDRRSRAQQVNLSLIQRWRAPAAGKDRAILRTGAAINLRDAAPDPEDESLDAFGEVTLRGARGTAFDAETRWNTDTGSHRVSGFDLSYLKDQRWFLRTGMRWVADDREFLTAAYGVRLSPRWAVAAEQWLDTNDGELSEASLSVDRTGQCYGLTLELRYFQSADPDGEQVSDEYRVLAKLRLLNVGSVATPSLAIEREADTTRRRPTTTEPTEAPGPDQDSIDPGRVVRDILRGSFL
jgi:lipopolysaccharide assembly outer membrane protein LptD (OstA)